MRLAAPSPTGRTPGSPCPAGAATKSGGVKGDEMMENEIIVAPVDLVKPQPKSRLVSIVSILRKVAELSEGELTVPELADALITKASEAYDGDTMMLYPGGGYGLAEPMIGDPKWCGYNERVEIVCELYNSELWNKPGATILARPYGRIDVEDLLVLKDDGVEMARRLWQFFYPNQEKTIDESVIAEGVGTKRSVEKSAIRLIDDAEREGNQVPEELDIALIAWRAACNGVKQGEKPGAFIRDWLAKNYPALSDEARKRIAIVANWDKTPGAGKKSPGQ